MYKAWGPYTLGSLYYVLVGLRRLELPTSRLSGVRSNRLSYKPNLIFKHLSMFFLF